MDYKNSYRKQLRKTWILEKVVKEHKRKFEEMLADIYTCRMDRCGLEARYLTYLEEAAEDLEDRLDAVDDSEDIW